MVSRFLFLILIISSLNGSGQTVIKSFSVDTTGLFHWSLVIDGTEEPVIAIQKKVGENWLTISEWTERLRRYSIVSKHKVGSKESSTHVPTLVTPRSIISSKFFPVEKGINTYRLIVKKPELVSNEVSVNRTTSLSKLTAKGDFINFDDYYCFNIMDANGILIKDIPRANFLNISDL